MNMSFEIAFDNEIVEDILDRVEKGNELMNQFFIERIYQNLSLFKVQLRQTSSNHFVML